MNALVLAGGENRRFKSHKALAEVKGRRMIETSVGLLSGLFPRVFISTNSPEKFFYLGCPMVGDLIGSRGPLTGVYSGLVMTGSSELFVVACDMPFISGQLVRLLKERYKGQDALLPVHKGRPEPLLGIYSGRLQNIIMEHIMQDRRAIWDLLEDINADYLDEESVLSVDREGLSFININTPGEYKEFSSRV